MSEIALQAWLAKHVTAIILAFYLCFVAASVAACLFAGSVADQYFTDNAHATLLQNALINLGCALIGATAFVSSLVVFSTQINVERMPYGLFRKISADSVLMGLFAAAFFLALIVLSASQITEADFIKFAVAIALDSTLLVIILLFLSYRRALSLISPQVQLGIVYRTAARSFAKWDRMATAISPAMAPILGQGRRVSRFDVARAQFFRTNNHWTSEAIKAVDYAIVYSRHHGGQGDHEVTEIALNTVVAINIAYIRAKRLTFSNSVPLLENPLVTDGFLNHALEAIKQNIKLGRANKDERAIELNFSTLEKMALMYLEVDYGDQRRAKTHANLVSGYLSGAVKSVLQDDTPDVVMEGLRTMGRVGRALLGLADPIDVTTIAEEMLLPATVGMVKQDHLPVLLTAMEQLSALTFLLLQVQTVERLPLQTLRQTTFSIATFFLSTPSATTPFGGNYLAPYFGINDSSLMSELIRLVNFCLNDEVDQVRAKRALENLSAYADDLVQPLKQLLILTLEKKAQFFFDLSRFLTRLISILLAGCNAPACTDQMAKELDRHASWLVHLFTWLPLSDEEAVTFAENSGVTEQLFEILLEAHARNRPDAVQAIRGVLLTWTVTAGAAVTGWDILKRGLEGLAGHALLTEDVTEIDWFKDQLTAKLFEPNSPTAEDRLRCARDLRRAANEFRNPDFPRSQMEAVLARINQDALTGLLREVADILSVPARPGPPVAPAED